MSALVKYSLQYTEAKQHDFSKNRICTNPVRLTLCNCTDSALDILIETASAIDSDSSADQANPRLGAAPSYSGFSWVGQASRHVSLSARQESQLNLLSCCSQPGVYDLSSVRVSAVPTDLAKTNKSVLQQRLAPCLLTITTSES